MARDLTLEGTAGVSCQGAEGLRVLRRLAGNVHASVGRSGANRSRKDLVSITSTAVKEQRPSIATRILRTDLLVATLVFVVCVVAVAIHVSAVTQLGPIDEPAHLDYVNRLASGHLPAYGEKLSPKTKREVACRGLESPSGSVDLGDCQGVSTDALPEQGFSYEAGQPPLYYGVAAILSRLTPFADNVDSIKLVGGLWLGVGAAAVYLTLRRFALSALYAAGLSLVLSLSPPLLLWASSINNDIAVWTFGALGLWLIVRLIQRPYARTGLILCAVLGVAGALTKPTALLVILAFVFCVVICFWSRGELKHGLLLGGVMLVSAVVATGSWNAVVRELQHQPYSTIQPFIRLHISSIRLKDLVSAPQAFTMVTPLASTFLPNGWLSNTFLDRTTQASIYLQAGLLLLPFLARWPKDPSRTIGIAYLIVVVISGPYYVSLFFFSIHSIGGADSRFGFGLVPFLAVIIATWIPNQWQRWVVAAVFSIPALTYLCLIAGA